MLSSFSVKNFRGFQNLTVEPLEQVNLIGGKNNSGKTAFLEAIFLFCGPNNPELPLRLGVFRGIEQFRHEAEDMFGWLFFKKNIEKIIEISALQNKRSKEFLKLQIQDSNKLSKSGIKKNGKQISNVSKISRTLTPTTTQPIAKELQLTYLDSKKNKSVSRVVVNPDGIRFERAKLKINPGIYLSTHVKHPNENNERFSRLEGDNNLNFILEPLRILEPNLDRLTILISSGEPVIHGDVGLGKPIPVAFMGEGVSKLLALLLAIANAREGTVLVDEIENGFHYSVLEKVWLAIAKAVKDMNVQLFATTHSSECIFAAHNAFKQLSKYSFMYHRLDRIGDDVDVKNFDQEMLETVTHTDLEVR